MPIGPHSQLRQLVAQRHVVQLNTIAAAQATRQLDERLGDRLERVDTSVGKTVQCFPGPNPPCSLRHRTRWWRSAQLRQQPGFAILSNVARIVVQESIQHLDAVALPVFRTTCPRVAAPLWPCASRPTGGTPFYPSVRSYPWEASRHLPVSSPHPSTSNGRSHLCPLNSGMVACPSWETPRPCRTTRGVSSRMRRSSCRCAMLDVPGVEGELLVPGECVATPHLDEARQARLDLQASGLRRRILGRVRHGQRTGTDEVHLAPDHVPQARQLIEAGATEQATDPGDAVGVGLPGWRRAGAWCGTSRDRTAARPARRARGRRGGAGHRRAAPGRRPRPEPVPAGWPGSRRPRGSPCRRGGGGGAVHRCGQGGRNVSHLVGREAGVHGQGERCAPPGHRSPAHRPAGPRRRAGDGPAGSTPGIRSPAAPGR